MNDRIEYLFDRDHQIGHAFFISCRDSDEVHDVMRHKIIPLLVEYFYEDWEKVRQVLGETVNEGAFIKRTKLPAPKGIDDDYDSKPRWRYSLQNSFAIEAYKQLAP